MTKARLHADRRGRARHWDVAGPLQSATGGRAKGAHYAVLAGVAPLFALATLAAPAHEQGPRGIESFGGTPHRGAPVLGSDRAVAMFRRSWRVLVVFARAGEPRG